MNTIQINIVIQSDSSDYSNVKSFVSDAANRDGFNIVSDDNSFRIEISKEIQNFTVPQPQ